MLLKDERFVDSVRGDITQHSAEWDGNEFVYIQGDYIIRFQADDVLTEDVSIALNEEGEIVATIYQTLMSGEESIEHKILSDEEVVDRLKYISLITPLSEGELLENKVLDPWDWDFVDFMVKHRPDLMI